MVVKDNHHLVNLDKPGILAVPDELIVQVAMYSWFVYAGRQSGGLWKLRTCH